MKKQEFQKFNRISDEDLEKVMGGRRRSSGWQKDMGQFINGFIHGWVVIPNNGKDNN